MPITPRFHLTQTETHVILDIQVPHVRVNAQSVEVLIENNSVHFSSPPYLLVLGFPFPFRESNNEGTAKYDPIREGGMVTMMHFLRQIHRRLLLKHQSRPIVKFLRYSIEYRCRLQ